jgi:hypothetical protein
MHRRRTKDYEKVLLALKQEGLKHGLYLQPKQIMTDFELAAIKAFKNSFIGIKSLFHFGQSLMKHLANIGLKKRYEDNEDLKKWLNRLFSLALCPLQDVDDQWEKILEAKPSVPRIDEFQKY